MNDRLPLIFIGAAGWVAAVVAGGLILAFPNTETKVVTKTVTKDSFSGFAMKSSTTEPITETMAARCEYWENRPGIIEGSVPPSKKDVILIRCVAVERGPVG